MGAKLHEIIAATRRRVSDAMRNTDLRALERQASEHKLRRFRDQLAKTAESGIAIIAELKKASPSKGLIRAEFDVRSLAREFEAAGTAALSVLTDEEFFQGSLENLRAASAATQLPCVRKDFIVDEFQLLEARANRADAVLLIVAALAQPELVSLARRARDLELDVLCEAHDDEELQRAADSGCDLIGINNRDLRSFKVDLETAFRLADRFPNGVLRVAESGIRTGSDIARLRAVGYQAFLIGESLMRAEKPGEALRALLATANHEQTILAARH